MAPGKPYQILACTSRLISARSGMKHSVSSSEKTHNDLEEFSLTDDILFLE